MPNPQDELDRIEAREERRLRLEAEREANAWWRHLSWPQALVITVAIVAFTLMAILAR